MLQVRLRPGRRTVELKFEDRKRHVNEPIHERGLRGKDSMANANARDRKIAKVRRALGALFHEQWVVKVADGPDLEVQGNLTMGRFGSIYTVHRLHSSRGAGVPQRNPSDVA